MLLCLKSAQSISEDMLSSLEENMKVITQLEKRARRLMQHYNILTRLISLHDHNEQQRAKQLIEKLSTGQNIALISDAGTPLISDPGYGLVSQCREASISVVPLPGPCAAITALSGAGLPTDRFKFEGFLPVKAMARQQALESLLHESSTCVFYESPRRVLDTVKLIGQVLGEQRRLVLAKELTKTFETFYSGTAKECMDWLQADLNHQKGEFVLMVAGEKQDQTQVSPEAIKLLTLLMKELPLKRAAAITAEQYGLKKNILYQMGLDL